MDVATRQRANLAWAKASEAQATAEEASAAALVASAEAQQLEGREDIAYQYLRLSEYSRIQATIYRDAAAEFRRMAG
ncbi:MAG TPA: hypothetical protein VHX44_09875 [Planctomycetota bacterium]|jgi:hypothetical protein|nr:hypothetical protein [Planctomycetota bacterium]